MPHSSRLTGADPRGSTPGCPRSAPASTSTPAHLPGRGARFAEPMPHSADDLIPDIAAEMTPFLGDAVVFGRERERRPEGHGRHAD
ncbi:hypothetical protein ABZS71_13820 [Streptomyces sp. NPDC005393]|uniref:hypothetical protein n=1 Tax=Streptomyces sp. NPDC005393 TaxID=3157041 RepID=UPI00339F6230